MARYYRLNDRGESTASLPVVFDSLDRSFAGLSDEGFIQPMRRRSLAIHWEPADELLLEINVTICQPRVSFSAKEIAATEHTASLNRGCHQPRPSCRSRKPALRLS
jgi:hypothetical protein